MPITDLVNHQFRLAARPVGLPKHSDWSYTEEPVGEPGDGEVLVKILYISLDPAMRGWMNEGRSYIAPVGLGEVMRALAAGRVIASKHERLEVGDHVTGLLGVQEYALTKGDAVLKVDAAARELPVHLGTLGMPGMTAYFGLLDIGRPVAGETVVVSGAAGAVGGSSVRSPSWRAAAPWGSRAAARSAATWCQSSASMPPSTTRPRTSRLRCASTARMASTCTAGKLYSREDIAEDLENFPDTLLRLYRGENTGKLVLKLAEEGDQDA